MFYPPGMRVEYREEACRTALNRVKGMPFAWSLNPYTGCAHRCTFCYVRAFEARAERPSDDRYGRSIRVKVNVAEVLRRELARPSWTRECVAIEVDRSLPGARGLWTGANAEPVAVGGRPSGVGATGPSAGAAAGTGTEDERSGGTGRSATPRREREATGRRGCRGSSASARSRTPSSSVNERSVWARSASPEEDGTSGDAAGEIAALLMPSSFRRPVRNQGGRCCGQGEK